MSALSHYFFAIHMSCMTTKVLSLSTLVEDTVPVSNPIIKLMAKRGYVKMMRHLGALAGRTGILGWLDRRQDRRGLHWLRSLFAIYDVDQMIALDVPWWTYRAIDAVDQYLQAHPNAAVFEFGSGASTVWLARRAGTVHSVEHDKDWFDLMQSRIAPYPSITLTHVPADAVRCDDPLYHSQKEAYLGRSFQNYVKTIADTGQTYDLIVIDGRARQACLHVAQTCLAKGGMIVFDNTKRTRYDAAIRKSDFVATHFSGMTPSLPYPDKTTLLRHAQTSGRNA